MHIYRTEQYSLGGNKRVFYSVYPPAINNEGSTLLARLNSIVLRGEQDDVLAVEMMEVNLMGIQTINFEQCPIERFLDYAGVHDSSERQAIYTILEDAVRDREEQFSKIQG